MTDKVLKVWAALPFGKYSKYIYIKFTHTRGRSRQNACVKHSLVGGMTKSCDHRTDTVVKEETVCGQQDSRVGQ